MLINGVEARRAAQTATEVAVREARSMDWTWDRISLALDVKPDGEAIRRRSGSRGEELMSDLA
ncbi:hypothetical protein MTY59_19560 [Mycobacterium senriense]|uniref:Uncharacterized protein n=1 Tax=Mycobacterium senriense TaxID=2775496 RepID=A0ABM7SVU0_9MYCO|nr:hypothetical protein MTY59_19560 [Mycobacterium senriense]